MSTGHDAGAPSAIPTATTSRHHHTGGYVVADTAERRRLDSRQLAGVGSREEEPVSRGGRDGHREPGRTCPDRDDAFAGAERGARLERHRVGGRERAPSPGEDIGAVARAHRIGARRPGHRGHGVGADVDGGDDVAPAASVPMATTVPVGPGHAAPNVRAWPSTGIVRVVLPS